MNLGIIRKWWARLGLGLAAIGGVIVLLASPDDVPLDASALIAVILATLAWIVSELPEGQPHPHDVELANAFEAYFPEQVRYLLRDVSFGDPVPDGGVLRLFDFADNWTGSKHEFEDQKLNDAVQTIWGKARKLANLIATNTFIMRGAGGYRTVKTDEDIQTGRRSDRTIAVARDMDEKATELLNDVEKFDRLLRKRLRIRT